ncbi:MULTISPECIES: hypothetical protein [unclassified Empedobacter]|uniref:hypothetical protein n=1 Tax=unclassified Empedobacter TaxID=2643773 RepID=UPI0025BC98F1|nr:MULTISPECIES: hypothetical protein [unclassified Empedobacter]
MIRKIFLVAASFMMMSTYTFAQNESKSANEDNSKRYKLAVSKGKMNLDLGRVTVEGYNGNEIVFSTKTRSRDNDERAKGLRSINSLGLEDNTDLGINVVEKNGIIEVKQLQQMTPPNIKILVPKGVTISFNHQSQFGSTITFKNIENEVEATASYNNVVLENVTGPATINTIYGSIDAKFSQNVKGPLSLVSIYGHVDASIPKSSKANVKLTTSFGDILIAPELSLKLETVDKSSEMIKINNQATGTLNGGGTSFLFRSDYSKIYLRAL